MKFTNIAQAFLLFFISLGLLSACGSEKNQDLSNIQDIDPDRLPEKLSFEPSSGPHLSDFQLLKIRAWL